MKAYEVTCATVSFNDPTPGGITHIGGPAFPTITRSQAVLMIDSGAAHFYTADYLGRRARVYSVHPMYGSPYITTSPDGSTANNLLSLSACRI